MEAGNDVLVEAMPTRGGMAFRSNCSDCLKELEKTETMRTRQIVLVSYLTVAADNSAPPVESRTAGSLFLRLHLSLTHGLCLDFTI